MQCLWLLEEVQQIWYAVLSSGTFWNSVNNSLRIKFKLCMCSSVLSSVNSYALNGLDDWQHPCLCCFSSGLWEGSGLNQKEVFSFKKRVSEGRIVSQRPCAVQSKQTQKYFFHIVKMKWYNNRNILLDIVIFFARHYLFNSYKKNTFNSVCLYV